MKKGFRIVPEEVGERCGWNAAVLLADVAEEWAYRYRSGELGERDSVFRSVAKMEERTHLTTDQQRTAIEKLKAAGWLDTFVRNSSDIGLAMRRYFVISEEVQSWALGVWGKRPEREPDPDELLPPEIRDDVRTRTNLTKTTESSREKSQDNAGKNPETNSGKSPDIRNTDVRKSERRSGNTNVLPVSVPRSAKPRQVFKGEEEHPLMADDGFRAEWSRWLAGSQGARNKKLDWRMETLDALAKLPVEVARDNVRFAADQGRPGIGTKNFIAERNTHEPRKKRESTIDEFAANAAERRRLIDAIDTSAYDSNHRKGAQGMAGTAIQRSGDGTGDCNTSGTNNLLGCETGGGHSVRHECNAQGGDVDITRRLDGARDGSNFGAVGPVSDEEAVGAISRRNGDGGTVTNGSLCDDSRSRKEGEVFW